MACHKYFMALWALFSKASIMVVLASLSLADRANTQQADELGFAAE
jgi:hypothetical protein